MTGLRAALYLRVSREEQVEGYSLDAQRRAFHQLVADRDWQAVGDYADEGKSARTEKITQRTAFLQMVADAEARRFEVLVVHKLDRFSRNLRVTLEYFDRLARAGVGFLSISEQIDYSTPQGKLFFHMLSVLAQFFSDNLSQETKKGLAERKAQGLYNGLLPFGVVKGDGGVPVQDRRLLANGSCNYDGLVAGFQQCAAGQSDAEVAGRLNALGYRTTGNRGSNPFRKDTVRRMLLNRFYVGDLPDGKGGWQPGAHPAILPLDLFDAAQRARAERRQRRCICVARTRQVYSLSGFLRCWHCEQSGDSRRGSIRIANSRGMVYARCAARIEGLACRQPSVPLDLIEVQFECWLAGIVVPEDAVEEALARERPGVGPLGDERRHLEKRLERLRELYSWGDLDRVDYQAERDRIVARLRLLVPVQGQGRDLERLATMLRSALVTWRLASQSERNELASKLVRQVVMRDDQAVAIVPRPDVAPWAPEWQPSASSCGSDGDRSAERTRYRRPHNLLPEGMLRAIAVEAESDWLVAVARRYGVARQTVRRAVALYGSVVSSKVLVQ